MVNLGLRGKLSLGFAGLTLILVISVIINLFMISNVQQFSKKVINLEFPLYASISDLNSEIFLANSSLLAWGLSQNEKYKTQSEEMWEHISKTTAEIDNTIVVLNRVDLTSTWNEIKSILPELKLVQTKILTLDSKNAAQLIITQELPLANKVTDKLNTLNGNSNIIGLLDLQHNSLSAGVSNVLEDMIQMSRFEYLILAVGLLTAFLISLATIRMILPPLIYAIQIAKNIAGGQRHLKINNPYTDETGQLLSSLMTMQQSIKESESKLKETENKTREMFNNIVQSANQFRAHSSKVAAGDLREHLDIDEKNNQDIMVNLGKDLNAMTANLSTITKEIINACQNMVTTVEEVRHSVGSQTAGASEQASSINQITASLSEIEKSSTQTMEKAKALGEASERTREKGELGLEAVDQSVDGMKSVREKVQVIAQTILDLSHQTQQVGEITAVVNNLAQQSKMLALNASIEAAKAGEAGKGFAVVATEVKNLAEQSEEATTQVQKILEDIRHAAEKAVMVTEEGTKGVDLGTQLVEQTGDVIRNLNDVIHETSIATQQIESAVRQESAGIEQISAGMNEINQVTTSFVDSVKQTTEAISHLSSIAQKLKSYIDTYKI